MALKLQWITQEHLSGNIMQYTFVVTFFWENAWHMQLIANTFG